MHVLFVRPRNAVAAAGVTALVAGLLAGPMVGTALATASVFTVTVNSNAADTNPGDGTCAVSGGGCSLRAAIQESNANAGTDTINFNLAAASLKITLNSSGLPAITDPVIVDGTSEPSFNPPTTIVRVDGNTNTTGVQEDFDVEAGGGGTTIKGLEIVGAGTAEVQLAANGNTVSGDYVGTTAGNATTCGSESCGGEDGIRIQDSNNNIVGGVTAADRNVISNNNYGVHVLNLAGTSSTNIIEGNYIGVNKTGSAALPNQEGVYVDDESGNDVGPSGTVVGGTASGAGNLISGNNDSGVYLAGGAGASITGNTIGLNVSGAKLGNGYGIYAQDPSTSLTVGGPSVAARNIVSGNTYYGIDLAGPLGAASLIQNNYLGLAANGSTNRGNGEQGILSSSVDNLTVDGNLVSGNATGGGQAQLEVDYGNNDVVSNNIAGFASDGSTVIASPCDGLYLYSDQSLTVSGNVTGGDNCHGIEVDYADSATITDNKSGTDSTGTLQRANASDGFYTTGSNDVQLGAPGHGNVFSGNNNGTGIYAFGLLDSRIQGNLIGTNLAGTSTINNGYAGIDLEGSDDNQIGGTASGAGNVVAGVGGGCCYAAVYFGGSSNNTMLGNRVGIGSGGQNLANSYDGVALDSASNHDVIGSTASGGGNLIQNNANNGICNNGLRNTFVGNTITANGALGIDNACDGVTPNDPGDKDTGANDLQNFPVLTNSLSNASGTQVTGTLNSRPSRNYEIDFYASNSCDSSGNGEGTTYLGSTSVTTDSSGNATFSSLVSGAAADNQKITATATSPLGDTSEFSACRVNHSGLPTLSVANSSASESAGNMSFTVSLSGPPVNTPVTVQYATQDGSATAPADYTATSGTLTFGSGETTKQVLVPIVNDNIDEPNETFSLVLSNPTNALIGAGQGTATGTINDDDATPLVSITSNGAVAEGNSGTTPQSFTISLNRASASPITVTAATVPSTATADVDYQSTANSFTFAPGETSKTFTVQVIGDTLYETDEIYNAKLFSPTNANLGGATAHATITNDDAPPAVSVGDVSVAEGNSGTKVVSVPVTLSAPSGLNTKISLDTVAGTATPGQDYKTKGTPAAPATLTITHGQVSANFNVTIYGDTTVEPDETFTVNIVGTPTNATVADGSGTVTIQNDD